MEKKSLKRPKIQQEENKFYLAHASSHIGEEESEEEEQGDDDDGEDNMTEEALVLMISKLDITVYKYASKIEFYKSQLEVAKNKLMKSKKALARLRSKKAASSAKPAKPLLVIPPKNLSKSNNASSSSSDRALIASASSADRSTSLPMPSNQVIAHSTDREDDAHDYLSKVKTEKQASLLVFDSSNVVSSEHKRRLRCLEMCRADHDFFATSALDGRVNIWQVRTLRDEIRGVELKNSYDFLSPKVRRWPEDIAWHPCGDRIFSVHTADANESQVAMLDLTQSEMNKAVFLDAKPHKKGLLNRINFMPWVNESSCFTTSGTDHGVVLWKEDERKSSWRPQLLHGHHHTSAVMAAFGLQNRKVVLSVGMDKKVVLYDISAQQCMFKSVLDAKCLNVLPNPIDFNLYMVQIGEAKKQLRLFDVRKRPDEVHAFGWNQDKSESQSALVTSAWAPGGWHVSSGSADNFIHFFDIRYIGNSPSQSMEAHDKRVFKAAWHGELPFLFSISSDLNIGYHSYQ